MLDELRDLFLAALKFEGNDAMPLVNRWNEAVKRVQAVFDNMTSKTVDAAPVVRCRDCKWYKESPLLAPNRFCYRLKDRDGKHIGYNFSELDFCSRGERPNCDGDMRGAG